MAATDSQNNVIPGWMPGAGRQSECALLRSVDDLVAVYAPALLLARKERWGVQEGSIAVW